MAWSTRELAELTGTTTNTIRHYHRIGLLEEPERQYNGYKQYDLRHLVSLLRIRRLTELGLRLSQIGAVSSGADSTPAALQDLDAELQATIRRLQKARKEISLILRDDAPADAPAGFESVASRLSEADSSIIHIYSRFYDEDTLADVRKMVDADTDDLGTDFSQLVADAGEEERLPLVERLARTIEQNIIAYPWFGHPASSQSKSGTVTAETVAEAVARLYNPAQLDVLARAGALAGENVRILRQRHEDVER